MEPRTSEPHGQSNSVTKKTNDSHHEKILLLSAFVACATFANAQTFTGNGATGFGDQIGTGSITATLNGPNVDFSLTGGAQGFGNDLVIYIDSISGGFTSTSTFTDTADGGRRAISGVGVTSGQSVVNFASGFTADFAIDLTPTFGNIFSLNTGSLGYITGLGTVTTSANVTTFSLALSDIGSPTTSFSFVGNILNPNDGSNANNVFRSNETFGTSVSSTGGNPGNNGTLTFSTSDTVLVPEPTSLALMAIGSLGSVLIMRRRRQS